MNNIILLLTYNFLTMEVIKNFIKELLTEVKPCEEIIRAAESISDTQGIPYISSLPSIVRNLNLFNLERPNYEQERHRHNTQSAYKSVLKEAMNIVFKAENGQLPLHEEKIFVRTVLEVYFYQPRLCREEEIEPLLHLCCRAKFPF